MPQGGHAKCVRGPPSPILPFWPLERSGRKAPQDAERQPDNLGSRPSFALSARVAGQIKNAEAGPLQLARVDVGLLAV